MKWDRAPKDKIASQREQSYLKQIQEGIKKTVYSLHKKLSLNKNFLYYFISVLLLSLYIHFPL
jgi:hypothetical protein